MKTSIYHKPVLLLTGLSLFLAACTNDVYEPKTGPTPNEEGVSQELKDFGFATRKDVKLSVNYDAPGFRTLVKVYSENPVDKVGSLKEGLEPVYSAFTDGNGTLDAKMYIPTSIKEAYLYTFTIGLPMCVKLEATADGFVYDATTVQTKVMTKAQGDSPFVDDTNFPYLVKANTFDGKRRDNLYSLVKWDVNGVPSGERVSGLDGNVKIGAKNEQVGVVSSRVTKFLRENNVDASTVGNKKLLRDPNQINIKAPAEGVEVSVTYAGAKGEYDNSFGYYYYRTDNPLVAGDFYAAKKYIIFPHTHNDNLIKPGTTVKLTYFDEQGKALDKFPAGYTVGWFLISDGFNQSNASYLKQIDKDWLANYGNTSLTFLRNVCFSNETGDWRQFITVYDETSKMYVVGIEDQVKGGQDDYMDLTFYVTTTPDLGQGDLEEIPGNGTDDPSAKESLSGTLAFEDIWPTGGDYDMNDVALRYSRDITFDKDNNVTTLEEHFKFIQDEKAATINNYFAYQVQNMGTVVEKPADCTIETETSSFIITTSAMTSSGKEFTIKRTFNGTLSKDVISKDFNPFIIVGELKNNNRKEVHLPMMKATSKADQSLIGTVDEAYYMDKEGKYPFAIDIAKGDFELSKEWRSIDKTYPRFATWAKNHGKTDADWYTDAPKKQ